MHKHLDKIIEWDILNWAQLLEYWTPLLDGLPRDSKVLAIGERNGGLSAWLALKGFEVVCTDRELPGAEARDMHWRLGVADQITYNAFDVVNDNWTDNQFDIVVCKSVIGGLKADPANRLTRSFEVQQKAVGNIHRLLKNGGYFLAAENMQGPRLMRILRRWCKADTGWRHLSMNELPGLFKEFDVKQMAMFGLLPTSFRSAMLNSICFSANKYVFHFLPDRYKYISFTVAQKVNK